MNIFNYNHYKEFLRDLLDQKSNIRGYQNKLASYANCQTSHLSQVLNRDKDLTLDQAFDLVSSLDLGELECEYFVKLVQAERAGSMRHRNFVKTQLENIRKRHQRLSDQIQKSSEKTAQTSPLYYSHWSYLAVHVASFIPDKNNSIKLSQFLGLSENVVLKALSELKKMGLMEEFQDGWRPKENNLNIKDDDSNIRNHHLNWRLKSLDHIPTSYNSIRDLIYSGVYAISHEDQYRIKSELNGMIVKIRDIALNSEPEVCFNFNVDFYSL